MFWELLNKFADMFGLISAVFTALIFLQPRILASIDAVTLGKAKSLTIPLEDGECSQFQ